ncbi:MAG: malate dehydrogenase [Amphiamblys sp. WSBS2006]|nr:MAG: malate dehydrogenase [Amphiamblys sp. WSBS2006]
MKTKVSVLGACGEIGKILSVLLKLDERLSHVSLYDIANIGIALDASYIPTGVAISGHRGPSEEALRECLIGSTIVVVVAGAPYGPGFSREKAFDKNAKIVSGLASSIASVCPKAQIIVTTNPVNSLVPLVHEVYQRKGLGTPNVLGLVSLDIARARVVVGEAVGVPANDIDVQVIGGHSDGTMLPVLSSVRGHTFADEERRRMSERIVNCVHEVLDAREGMTASLSTAYAIKEIVDSIVESLGGETPRRPLAAFVKNEKIRSGYFSSRLVMDKGGSFSPLPLPAMSGDEEKKYEEILSVLTEEVGVAVSWAEENLK